MGPALSWWRAFCILQAARLCRGSGTDLENQALSSLLAESPPSVGLDEDCQARLAGWGSALCKSLSEAAGLTKTTPKALLAQANPQWARIGRVHFDLGEDFSNPEKPFSFGASYAIDMGSDGNPIHIPLSRAIKSFALAGRQSEVDSAVLPLCSAEKKSPWVKQALADPSTGPLLKSTRLGARQAFDLLRDSKKIEAAGILMRLPEAWNGFNPSRARVHATIGSMEPAFAGSKALLDFKVEVSVEGEPLSKEEIEILRSATDGLARIRGQWILADPDGLGAALRRFKAIEARAHKEGISFAEAMSIASSRRGEIARDEREAPSADWIGVKPGAWLEKALADLRSPGNPVDPGSLLATTLRPYQLEGLRWLHGLHRLGLGACLADDMGLGKTIQILSLLLVLKRDQGDKPSLLAAPASLLDNWANEAAKFAPNLRVAILHGDSAKNAALADFDPAEFAQFDLVVTSYGSLMRSKSLRAHPWRLAIADEAQALKNPSTQTAQSCKELVADTRIALTGTPVENRLSDLWSLLDFTHPGLLGSRADFNAFHARLAEQGNLEPLRELVRPYVLRRKKTDKSVISDLPEKIETTELCPLTPRQGALYQSCVEQIARDLTQAKGFGRHGIVIAALTRLKQICNHPAHMLRDGPWRAADSGKIQMLRELAQEIAYSDGRVLVFTQYQEAVVPITEHLAAIFGKPGLSLHGGIRVGKERQRLVDAFQAEDGPPFMVLTVKAGGTGLNLTAANHVIHFDRWWNPAVENQATDRAFRIGQNKNVMVHKLVCKGTVEERIDHMIASKIQLAEDAVGSGSEAPALSTLSDKEILDLVRLDIHDR